MSHIISYYVSYVTDEDENRHYFTSVRTTNEVYFVEESPYRINTLIKKQGSIHK